MLRFGRVDDGTMEFIATPGRNADAGLAQHGTEQCGGEAALEAFLNQKSQLRG